MTMGIGCYVHYAADSVPKPDIGPGIHRERFSLNLYDFFGLCLPIVIRRGGLIRSLYVLRFSRLALMLPIVLTRSCHGPQSMKIGAASLHILP